MSLPPKKISFEDLAAKTPPEPQNDEPAAASVPPPPPAPPPLPPSSGPAQPTSSTPLAYARQFGEQKYHPVVLIGPSAAGKTVLLLSLLAFFKGHANARRLAAFFGDDLYRPADNQVEEVARQYFDRSVAEYMGGTTEQKTTIRWPMFIPVKICGESRPDLKFAFMESNGEWYQTNRDSTNGGFVQPFKPELESLLQQYPDGISFMWIAPHIYRASRDTSATDAKRQSTFDAKQMMREADESLRSAFDNYEALRRNKSARDTHMLLVTKWDTHLSEIAPANVRQNLDRSNDKWVGHEVDNFLETSYPQTYNTFQSLNSPIENKVVFRYSAGLFDAQSINTGNLEDVLLTYPRDVWNWLYSGMRKGHDWTLSDGALIPKPAPPRASLLEQFDRFMASLFG